MDYPLIDVIYVDKHGDEDHLPDTWTYYRITSVTGLGNPEGTEGSTIQVCRLKWPTLEDIHPPTDTQGAVSFEFAYEAVNSALRHWGIEREKSIVIGIRERPENPAVDPDKLGPGELSDGSA
jgi:hypothetical protein